jgi:hypothetical protein
MYVGQQSNGLPQTLLIRPQIRFFSRLSYVREAPNKFSSQTKTESFNVKPKLQNSVKLSHVTISLRIGYWRLVDCMWLQHDNVDVSDPPKSEQDSWKKKRGSKSSIKLTDQKSRIYTQKILHLWFTVCLAADVLHRQ